MFYNFIKGNDYSTAVPKPEVQTTTESLEEQITTTESEDVKISSTKSSTVQTTSTVSPTTSVTSSVLNRWLFASLFALLLVNY